MVKARKRWTFPAACAFVQAHAALNPAGAARLLTWAVRRVAPAWKPGQSHPLVAVGEHALTMAQERDEAHGGTAAEWAQIPWDERIMLAVGELPEAAEELGWR